MCFTVISYNYSSKHQHSRIIVESAVLFTKQQSRFYLSNKIAKEIKEYQEIRICFHEMYHPELNPATRIDIHVYK